MAKKHELGIHIALVGLSLSILVVVVTIAVYFTKVDIAVKHNTGDIGDIKISVHNINENVQGLREDIMRCQFREPKFSQPIKVAGRSK